MNANEFQAHTEQIERLVEQVSALADNESRALALDLLQSLMDLHGAGLSRIVELLNEGGEAGKKSLAKVADDPLVCGLMVLYGIHPLDLRERVSRAIHKVSPQVSKQGGRVELLEVGDSLVRVSIHSSGNGCHSTPDALKLIVEQAIREAAPEIVEIVADGVTSSTSAFVPLNTIQPALHEEKSYEKSPA